MNIKKQIPLRIDNNIYNKLKEAAKEEDRSVNSYIVQLIKKDLKKKEGE
nr:MAG TPA: antitoxin [Caudoviricetes sp.]